MPASAPAGAAERLAALADPAALRQLPPEQLPALAQAIRDELIALAARHGGHFAASLGVVELTLALHRALDTPRDALVWDIGHQAYVHKLLTGRRERLATIRDAGGLSPFPTPEESRYDAFVAGHAGVAISAAAGMAAAARASGERRRCVAVIGDGGLTAGSALEALNHAGGAGLDLLVVLNDNGYSISENVGALARPGAPLAGLFAAFGFTHHGPVDGHDLPALEAAFAALRDAPGPRLLHVRTRKGAGYAPAEADPIGFHGVTGFDAATGRLPPPAAAPSWSQVFGEALCELAAADPRVHAITPAMREGSGLVGYARRFPARYHDVGIAEPHAATFAAGLAAAGARPVLAIYSTFLQRAVDGLIHDIALPRLPVVIAIDRAGPVGGDGATHHGAFDLSLLAAIPNLSVMAPSDAGELRAMLRHALTLDGPVALRFPRGSATPARREPDAPLEPGRARVLRESRRDRGTAVALIAVGAMLEAARAAAETLDATLVDLRWVKPLDEARLLELADRHALLVSIEDNARPGGAGSAIEALLARHGHPVRRLALGLPDRFLPHGTRDGQLAEAGLDAASITRAVRAVLG